MYVIKAHSLNNKSHLIGQYELCSIKYCSDYTKVCDWQNNNIKMNDNNVLC